MKKRLPIGISEFKEIIDGQYLYVDKTKILYELLQGKQYFLSRPRRFGKTLLISTLEQIFLGNSKLFKDTWIGSSDYEWKKHPVIRLNFSGMDYSSAEKFESSFNATLDAIALKNGYSFPQQFSFVTKFTFLMEQLSHSNPVVILIDEYDYPLITHVDNIEFSKQIKSVMQNFFTTLKATEPYMHFSFLTGVSRFSKTSIFSGLNNLNDITLDPLAADLLGYTQHDLENLLNQHVIDLAQEESASVTDTYTKLKTWYNGYRFSKNELRVYNPFSIINVLTKLRFVHYWFGTGTPSFLIKLLPQYYSELENLKKYTFDEDALASSFEIGQLRLDLLLYQTGYLTISNYHDGIYSLDFPNQEVSVAFNTHIFGYLTHKNVIAVSQIVREMRKAFNLCNVQEIFEHLQTLFSTLPYQLHNKRESYYHSIVHTFLYALGIQPTSENSTSKGRSDLVVETEHYIYIFEVKLDKSPQAALDQIKDKNYAEPYLKLDKKIVLIGLNFSYEEKQMQIDYKNI